MLALGGNWTFYWQQLLEPAEALASRSRAININGTGGWQAKQKADSYNAIGFGTYHLTVILQDQADNLAVRMPQIESAYKLYIDSELVASGGTVSDDESVARPGYNAQMVRIPQGKKTFTITIQVSNYHSSWGGLWSSPILGDAEAIHQLKRDKIALSMFILGALLITSTFSLIQFFLRPSDKTPLSFCLFVSHSFYQRIYS